MDDDRRRWGDPGPLWPGENPYTDLHHPNGTTWVRDPVRGPWPDCCDTHRPAEITEARRAEAARREAAERALAERRHRPYRPPETVITHQDAPSLPEPTIAPPPSRFGFLRRHKP